ncbi:MAG TPA: CatB-related O-acetyltransferase [Microbacteriaceae bacterium]|nr:CatB-related O-acetyltransferase [Microbacteriaceae bacterium]
MGLRGTAFFVATTAGLWALRRLSAGPGGTDVATASGEPRQAVAHTVEPAGRARSTTSAGPADGEMRPWRELREHGLRVERGLRLFGSGVSRIMVEFEPPVQINNATMHVYGGFRIGAYSFLRTGTMRHVTSIGRYTSIGPGVILGEGEHPIEWLSLSPTVFDRNRWFFHPESKRLAPTIVRRRTRENAPSTPTGKVRIGNDVWIGANAIIRRGVTIGDGAIVAAGAFVNRDVPPYTIVGGLPARKIRDRFDPGLVKRLLAFRWWEFDARDLAGVPFERPGEALDEIARRERAGRARRTPPHHDTVILTQAGWTDLRHRHVTR